MSSLPQHSTLRFCGKLFGTHLNTLISTPSPSVHTAVHTSMSVGDDGKRKKRKKKKKNTLEKNKESRMCWRMHHYRNAKTNTPPPRPLRARSIRDLCLSVDFFLVTLIMVHNIWFRMPLTHIRTCSSCSAAAVENWLGEHVGTCFVHISGDFFSSLHLFFTLTTGFLLFCWPSLSESWEKFWMFP